MSNEASVSPHISVENVKPGGRICEILSKRKPPEILAYLAIKTEQDDFKDVQDKITDEKKMVRSYVRRNYVPCIE